LEYQKKYAEGTTLIAKAAKEKADADAKAAKEKADAEAANIKQIAGRKAAEKIYRDTVLLTEQSVKVKYKTEKEGAADNQKAVEKYIDALIGLGYTFDDTSSIGGKALNDLVLKLNASKDGANKVSVAFAGVGDTLNIGVLPAFADFGIVLTSIDPEPIVQISNKIISMEEAMRLVPAAMEEMNPTSDLQDAWDEFTADMKTKGESWKGTFTAIGNIITSSIGAGLIKVGESLVTGAGWNEFGTIALKALASVLEALGAQLAAMAVWKIFVEKDVAGGLMLAAGAAAAFVAAGAASAMAAVSKKASDAAKSVNSLSQALDFSANSAGDVIKKMAGFSDITAQRIADEKALAFFQASKIKSMNEIDRLTGQNLNDWGMGLATAKSALNFDLFQIDLLNKKIADAVAYKSKVIQNANDALLISMNAVNAETKASYELFIDADQAGIAFRSILVSLGNAALSFAQSLQNVGTEISSNLIDALSKGLSESDFLQSMKDYILNAVVQAAVYTDEVKLRMGRIGQAIADGIASGFTSEGGLQSIKDDLSGLYYSVNASSGLARALVKEVFTDADQDEANAEKKRIEDIANAQRKADEEKATASRTLAEYKMKWYETSLSSSQLLIRQMDEEIAKAKELGASDETVGEINLYYSGKIIKATEDEAKAMKTVTTEVKETVIELSALEKMSKSFSESFTSAGSDIASKLISGLSGGLGKSDFMKTMKEYIMNIVIQTAVFTDAIKSKMESIGKAIADGISGGLNAVELIGIKSELESLYAQASATSKTATALVDSVFTGYASGTDYASAGYHMVGEQGPERVYLPQGARVTNAVNTANGLGGSSKNVTLAPVFNSPRAMNQIDQMRALKQYQRDMAFKGVI
jgi:hypothetical protein